MPRGRSRHHGDIELYLEWANAFYYAAGKPEVAHRDADSLSAGWLGWPVYGLADQLSSNCRLTLRRRRLGTATLPQRRVVGGRDKREDRPDTHGHVTELAQDDLPSFGDRCQGAVEGPAFNNTAKV